MDGRGGGRKPLEVWEHVIKLSGNRVKCKYCEFEFSAPSATRIASHLHSTPKQGIRGCPKFNLPVRGCGSSERARNVESSHNSEIEDMAVDYNFVVVANSTPQNTNKRKEIPVEVEQMEPMVHRHVRERLVEEVGVEESSSLHAPLRKTSVWPSIELLVAYLEEKLDASVVRERKLQEKLADLKVKSDNDNAALEAKAREEASQFMDKKLEMEGKLNDAYIEISLLTANLSDLTEKLYTSEKEKCNLANTTTSQTEEAHRKISLLTAQLSDMKEKLNAFEKEKVNLENTITSEAEAARKEISLLKAQLLHTKEKLEASEKEKVYHDNSTILEGFLCRGISLSRPQLLRPNIKHGGFTEEEDNIICSLFISIGSRWSIIAAQLPGRTNNDVKNYWNTKLKKKLLGRRKQSNFNTKETNGREENSPSNSLSSSALERLQLHMQLQSLQNPFSFDSNPSLNVSDGFNDETFSTLFFSSDLLSDADLACIF